MVEHMRQAMAALRRDIARWKIEMAQAKADTNAELSDVILKWIKDGEDLISKSGY